MDATIPHLAQSFVGTQGAALAVALSVGLLILTVLQHLQHVAKPRQSVSTSMPLKVEAVGFVVPQGYNTLMHQQIP